jgi:hypothetical protein
LLITADSSAPAI